MGKALLKEMESLNIILDATHLCDEAFWDAMEIYNAPIWASHNNCRTLVHHNRQFSDEMIQALIQKRCRNWWRIGCLDDDSKLAERIFQILEQ
jgi:membrane dipeptidase